MRISSASPRKRGMMAALERTTAPDNSVLLTNIKSHLRVDYADENTIIQGYIDAAVDYVERATRRSLLDQSWTLTLDYFPDELFIKLPNGPVQSVTTFTTYDEDNNADTSFTDYYVDTAGGRIVLDDGASWPTDLRTHANISIEYVTGYGDTEADIPDAMLQAVYMLCDHWFNNRAAALSGEAINSVPMAVDTLIGATREWKL